MNIKALSNSSVLFLYKDLYNQKKSSTFGGKIHQIKIVYIQLLNPMVDGI